MVPHTSHILQMSIPTIHKQQNVSTFAHQSRHPLPLKTLCKRSWSFTPFWMYSIYMVFFQNRVSMIFQPRFAPVCQCHLCEHNEGLLPSLWHLFPCGRTSLSMSAFHQEDNCRRGQSHLHCVTSCLPLTTPLLFHTWPWHGDIL